MTARRTAAVALDRAGLTKPAFRLFEWALTVPRLSEHVSARRREGADGMPLPPPHLRVQIIGTTDPDEFLAQGRRAADTIADIVRSSSGRSIEEFGSVLDFGCGAGRVMRRWADLAGPALHGCDYNPRLVAWCRSNLTYASFKTNTLEPPLPYEDGQFDLVYAISVFTHLTEPLQHAWMAEMQRVVKPGGLLIFSTRGDAHRDKLNESERARYDSGDLVVRYGGVEGTNLCAALHPREYLAGEFLSSFKLLESRPAALEDGAQDLHAAERLP